MASLLLRFFRWWFLSLIVASPLAWGQSAPTLTFAPAPYLFLGQTMTFNVTASVRATYDGQWFKDGQPFEGPTRYNNLSTLPFRIGPVQASHAGEYYLQLRLADGTTVTSPRVRFSVVEPIRFTEQPAALIRVSAGGSATFSGNATGPGTINYQWYQTDFGSSFGIPIPGATARSLTVRDSGTTDVMSFYLEARNEYHAVRSATATMEVLLPPTISRQPTVSRTSTEGTFVFDPGFQGGTRPFTYSWQKNGAPLEITTRLRLDSSSGSLTITEATEADSGDYRLVVTNPYGTATSEPVRFTFTAAPKLLPIGVWDMRPQHVATGAAVTFTVGATGTPPPTYQWHFNGSPIAGATGTTLTLTNVTRANQGSYSVVVANSEGRVISPSVSLTVELPPASPTIHGQSSSLTVDAGRQFSLSVSADGAAPLRYQWHFNGTALPGETGMFLTFGSIKVSEAGSYTAVVTNAVGSATSRPIVVTVIPPSQAPTIGQHPEDKMANAGTMVIFLVGATATGLEYQWKKNGVAIPGATSFAYTISSVQPGDAGSYSVEVWNSVGRAVSRSATLTVGMGFPEIFRHPSDQRTSAGFSVELEVEARGTGLTYQWERGGVDIPGATAAKLSFAVAQVSDSGTYRVTVRNSSGAVRSNPATLTVLPSAEPIPPTRLANLSVRARLASAGEVLIVGFVSGGSATKQFLLRGVGPGLRQFGVNDAAEATAVALFRSNGSMIFRESSWYPEWQQNVFPRVGAFPLPAGSRDGVIWLETDSGAYTAHLEATAGNGGVVLAEVYDMNPQGYPSRFLNLSARGRTGGGNSLIAGFVITGTGTHTVIVRGVGPSLADLGVTDAIAAPQLFLRRTEAAGSTIVGSNSAWDFGLSAAFARAGAFPLRVNSRDTALMLSLPPGAYTAELTNSAAAVGTALIEVYDAR